MAYVLQLLRENFDEHTQTHNLHVQLIETDKKGVVVGKGEQYQRSFCLPGHDSSYDFEQELTQLKEDLIARYERTKKHKESLKKAVEKCLEKGGKK